MTTRILHIVASPSAAASRSTAVARHLIDRLRERDRAIEVDTLDLWHTELPAFDATMIEAKFAVLRAKAATEAQQLRWQQAVDIARRFNAADKYVFSLPMWNFGIPYRLKHYIDVVTLPGENWRWSREEGYRGLLHGKRAALVYSSAGHYPSGPAPHEADFQKPYMRKWLSFIGITDVHELNAAPTLAPPEVVDQAVARGKAEAGRLALVF